MQSERKQEEEKMVSNDADFCVICLEEKWGVAYIDLLQEENPYGVLRALPPRWKTMLALPTKFAGSNDGKGKSPIPQFLQDVCYLHC